MRTSREVPLLIISKHEPNRVLVLRYREEARSVMRLRVKLTTTRYDDAASAKSHTASSRVWKGLFIGLFILRSTSWGVFVQVLTNRIS